MAEDRGTTVSRSRSKAVSSSPRRRVTLGSRAGRLIDPATSFPFRVDPIEKMPLHHFLPGSAVLSGGGAEGILSARACANRHAAVRRATPPASPEEIARAARDIGCRSVAFFVDGPAFSFAHARAVEASCRAEGIRTVALLSVAGADEGWREFLRHVDAANVRSGSFGESFARLTDSPRLPRALQDLLEIRSQTRLWLEITHPVTAGDRHFEPEMDRVTRWIASALGPGVPLHLVPFRPATKRSGWATSPGLAALRRGRAIALANGLPYVYTGNVADDEGASTFCGRCGAKVVGRDADGVTAWELDSHGRCAACGDAIPGVFGTGFPARKTRRLPRRIRACAA